MIDDLLGFFVLSLFNDFHQEIVNLLAFKFFIFLSCNDDLFKINNFWSFDDIEVDPDIETINNFLNAIVKVFKKVWLIEFFVALKYLLPLHSVNGMNGHSLNKLFVNFVL